MTSPYLSREASRERVRAAALAALRTSQELEVTPAMIEEGVHVLWTSGAVEGELGCDRELVADIYRAMYMGVPAPLRRCVTAGLLSGEDSPGFARAVEEAAA